MLAVSALKCVSHGLNLTFNTHTLYTKPAVPGRVYPIFGPPYPVLGGGTKETRRNSAKNCEWFGRVSHGLRANRG